MEEMLDETLEAVDDDEELEEEANEEVDKVLFELTDGKLGNLGAVGADLPVSSNISHSQASQVSNVVRIGSGGRCCQRSRHGETTETTGRHAERIDYTISILLIVYPPNLTRQLHYLYHHHSVQIGRCSQCYRGIKVTTRVLEGTIHVASSLPDIALENP